MRAICIVLDSVGIGAMPDAAKYGDEGSATLQNTAKAVGGLKLPNLGKMGLGNIESIQGIEPEKTPSGSYGKILELSPGKDTTTGHWEMMGIKLEYAFPLFPEGFPKEWLKKYEKAIGRETIGNIPASGTEIIAQLGDEHVKTGKPIVYTSADSVFQVAAHEEVIPLKELYRLCEVARDMLQPPDFGVGRVIARPFIGTSGAYKRTSNRHDFSLKPGKTLLNVLDEKGITTYGIGKIFDIYAGQGVNKHVSIKNNLDGMDKTMSALKDTPEGFIFTNLVDFDMLFGHRRDARAYADALEEFDKWLPSFLENLNQNDLLILTSDHGCDPTFKGSDHTREYPFVLSWQKNKPGKNIGIRQGLWDIAASVASHLKVKYEFGTPFNTK
ncbi:MAG: phosphopentomutase [Candidatus Riflebacteria bacterium]|nr:phosphopentomutase [Candidatus Riflebacteria bacterium]